MARIRSIYPDQWNDEDFCGLSPLGRLLTLGLRNFADDNGAFEWKPLRLKMRIFPGDSVDGAALLAELEAAQVVRRYSVGGSDYGLVRNFRKFQRPKKPTGSYPRPDEWVHGSELIRYVMGVETDQVPYWYGTGSEPVRERSGNSQTDVDVEVEKKKKEQKPPLKPPREGGAEKTKRKATATAMPEGWAVPAEWIAEATAKDSATNWTAEAERFVSHHASKGSKFAAWKSAWWTWVNSPYAKSPARRAGGSELPEHLKGI